MDFTDSYGNWWIMVGAFAPTTDWLKISGEAENSSIFRLQFTTDWAEWQSETSYRFRSYGVIKEQYEPNGVGSGSPSFTQQRLKFTPAYDPLIISISPMFQSGDFKRFFLMKRSFWSPQDWSKTRPDLDIPWTVQIHRLEAQ